jgi:hypothetical protein
MAHCSNILAHSPTLPIFPELPPRLAVGVGLCHSMAGQTMTRPLLVQPGAPLVLHAGHELEVMGIDARRQSAGVIRLVPGGNPPAVEDLPRNVMAAADLLANAHGRMTVFVDGALPAQRRLDAIADKCLPEGH